MDTGLHGNTQFGNSEGNQIFWQEEFKKRSFFEAMETLDLSKQYCSIYYVGIISSCMFLEDG